MIIRSSRPLFPDPGLSTILVVLIGLVSGFAGTALIAEVERRDPGS